MKQLFAITSYHGQHDEQGAVITELATGKQFISTPGIEDGDWALYHAKNQLILAAFNALDPALYSAFLHERMESAFDSTVPK